LACFASFVAAARAVGKIYAVDRDAIALVYPPGTHSYGSEEERNTPEELHAQLLLDAFPEQQAYCGSDRASKACTDRRK
jgi:hypothetical protein